MDSIGKAHWASLSKSLREKNPFSPFKTGGVEVKATVGSVPTPAQCVKINCEKPDIGDQRINLLKSYDWKAHHRDSNRLFAILWDFIDKKPCICALFYCNSLTKDDWGEIIKPTEGGGRTTSVSIMTRKGVEKMYFHWVAIIKDQRYVDFLNKYNKNDLIKL